MTKHDDELPATPGWLAEFLWTSTTADVLSFGAHVGISGQEIDASAQGAALLDGSPAAARMLELPFVRRYRRRDGSMDRARFIADFAAWPPIANRVAELKAERQRNEAGSVSRS
ncbi:MAG: hypothetical protein FJX53_12800 [Alphaproteobacteria bacterium]|nr:hypothetical protein [Alphaproteobacteria bacterium]